MKTMIGVGLAAILGFVLAIGVGLSARALGQADPDEQAKAKEKARVDAILKKRAAMDRPLKGDWPAGDVGKLRDMDPEQIVKIQIFAIEWPDHAVDPRRPHIKQYLEHPYSAEEHRNVVASLLALLGRAKPFVKPGGRYEPFTPDRVLVVQPVEGEPFEFLYSNEFKEPFAGLASPELKEALWAMSSVSRVSIIRLLDGKVQQTLLQEVIAPEGSVETATMRTQLKMTPADGLMLAIKLRRDGEVLVDDVLPIRYEQATVFPSKDKATTIVLFRQR
jgi:hypothetical protein